MVTFGSSAAVEKEGKNMTITAHKTTAAACFTTLIKPPEILD